MKEYLKEIDLRAVDRTVLAWLNEPDNRVYLMIFFTFIVVAWMFYAIGKGVGSQCLLM